MEPALARIGAYRGVAWDAWRDEEPDRIPHERRLNPRAATGASNRELYYGDVVSTPFWIVTLAATYNWTGERALLARHRDTLDACCRWLERKLDEGGGFVYYAPADADGAGLNRHHAWKDSGDAIVDGRGRIRVPPLAAVEVQGYAYLALLSAAEIALAHGRLARARSLAARAADLKRRFDAAFWMPSERYYALALDGEGRQVDAITSNVGHCLGTGILDDSKLAHVAHRLLAPDLFSGWGVRTLSASNPAYDPFSYHRGSVWPVENATIAAGLALAGRTAEAQRQIGAQLGLATLFPSMRLPEAISGHARSEDHPVPGLYPQSNLLQAWSVSALALFLQVLLGIRAFAPLRTLLVKPALPEWLPWVELRGLAVGAAEVDLRFWRDARGRSRWKVLSKRGRLLVLEQPPHLAPDATLARRLRDAAASIGHAKLGLGLAVLGAAGWLGARARGDGGAGGDGER
jgi:glycogen debranching enzyme